MDCQTNEFFKIIQENSQVLANSQHSTFFISQQLFQQSILMRPRSGAFHCDSTEDFVALAEESQSKTGIFYDEKIHKKVMGKVKERKSVVKAKEIEPIPNPEIYSDTKMTSFSGFDFSLESQMQKQQRQQQERIHIISYQQINVGIVSDTPNVIIAKMNEAFGIRYFEQQSVRKMDLIVQVQHQIITKYWIFSKDTIKQNKNQLTELYLKNCQLIYDINCNTGTINILKNKTKSMNSIQRTIKACLNF